jgi:hypothetical protein
MSLVIGPGFQSWIAEHQATPISDELWFTKEQSMLLVKAADAQGTTQTYQLIYNKLTNEIFPFVQATL